MVIDRSTGNRPAELWRAGLKFAPTACPTLNSDISHSQLLESTLTRDLYVHVCVCIRMLFLSSFSFSLLLFLFICSSDKSRTFLLRQWESLKLSCSFFVSLSLFLLRSWKRKWLHHSLCLCEIYLVNSFLFVFLSLSPFSLLVVAWACCMYKEGFFPFNKQSQFGIYSCWLTLATEVICNTNY